jgi:hypothetical protein
MTSASWPGVIRPLSFSANSAYAQPSVYAADMDSTEIPGYEEQEQSVTSGHFESTCTETLQEHCMRRRSDVDYRSAAKSIMEIPA